MVAFFKEDQRSSPVESEDLNLRTEHRFLPIISYLEESTSLESLFHRLRKKHNLSQKQIGEIINSCHEVVSNLETGKRDLRTTEIIALAKFHPDFRLGAIAFFEREFSRKMLKSPNVNAQTFS